MTTLGDTQVELTPATEHRATLLSLSVLCTEASANVRVVRRPDRQGLISHLASSGHAYRDAPPKVPSADREGQTLQAPSHASTRFIMLAHTNSPSQSHAKLLSEARAVSEPWMGSELAEALDTFAREQERAAADKLRQVRHAIEDLRNAPDPLDECDPIASETADLANEVVRRVAEGALAAGLGVQTPEVSADLDGRLFLSWRSGIQQNLLAIIAGPRDDVVLVSARGRGAPTRSCVRSDEACRVVFESLASAFTSH